MTNRQRQASGNESNLLARVNFPPYCIKTLTERHLLVAGGGGPARTGVKNCIEIFELVHVPGGTCRAKLVAHYDTGPLAIMNATLFQDDDGYVLAAGMDGMCQLYRIDMVTSHRKEDFEASRAARTSSTRDRNSSSRDRSNSLVGEGLRRRRQSSTSSNVATGGLVDEESNQGVEEDDLEGGGGGADSLKTPRHERKPSKPPMNGAMNGILNDSDFPQVTFDITPSSTFQTDFHPQEPLQKVAKYSTVNHLLITGGADGMIRCWRYPQLTKLHEIQAHKSDVDDIDVNPIGSHIASASRDGHIYAWDLKNCKKIRELIAPFQQMEKYKIRSCKYGIVENDYRNFRLFSVANPLVRTKTPKPSYVCKWDQHYNLERCVGLKTDSEFSSMTVSADGRFVGLGTLTGDVSILIAFSLQKLYQFHSHNFFVTGVEFLQPSFETQQLTGDQDTSLISVSVDNHIVVHHVAKQLKLNFLGSLFFFSSFLLLIYLMMDFIGL